MSEDWWKYVNPRMWSPPGTRTGTSGDFNRKVRKLMSTTARWGQPSDTKVGGTQDAAAQVSASARLEHFIIKERAGARRDGLGGYQGCNSRVFRASLRHQQQLVGASGQGSEFALKMVFTLRGQTGARHVDREVALLHGRSSNSDTCLPRHPNVMEILHCFQEEVSPELWMVLGEGLERDLFEPQTHFLVMEMCLGSLQAEIDKQKSRKFTPPFFQTLHFLDMIEQMLSAVQHLTAHGLVHNDIKPDNWLLKGDERTPVLTDFGTCMSFRDSRAGAQPDDNFDLGASAFKAPELFAAISRKEPMDFSNSDTFSVGMCAYQMLCSPTQECPFGSPAQPYTEDRFQPLPGVDQGGYPAAVVFLVRSMLLVDKASRMVPKAGRRLIRSLREDINGMRGDPELWQHDRLTQLRDVFEHEPPGRLEACLRRHDWDVERAATSLVVSLDAEVITVDSPSPEGPCRTKRFREDMEGPPTPERGCGRGGGSDGAYDHAVRGADAVGGGRAGMVTASGGPEQQTADSVRPLPGGRNGPLTYQFTSPSTARAQQPSRQQPTGQPAAKRLRSEQFYDCRSRSLTPPPRPGRSRYGLPDSDQHYDSPVTPPAPRALSQPSPSPHTTPSGQSLPPAPTSTVRFPSTAKRVAASQTPSPKQQLQVVRGILRDEWLSQRRAAAVAGHGGGRA